MTTYTEDPSSGGSELVLWARGKVREGIDATGTWRTQTREAFGAVAGDQWREEDESHLEAEGRPAFTFNRLAGFIRGICGLESSSRNTTTYYAREMNDTGLNEVINSAVNWVRDMCNAEDEESDAFRDMLICGLGWTETYFTTEFKQEGEIVIERVDPMHMRWDPSARKRGLVDSRWRARIKWLPLGTIRDVWGDEKADEIETMTETDSEILDESWGQPHENEDAPQYASQTVGNARRKGGYPVIQFQYVKTAWFYRVRNPQTGAEEEVSEDVYKKLQGKFKLKGDKFKKRQYRQLIYCGVTELQDEELAVGGFTFNCITGIRDRNEGTWYGFVRDLLDPQRWINKFFSSMADVVASQAKGGLLAEASAFVDKERAAEDWADPRAIVWLNEGGLEKIKERTAAGVPAGFSQLLEFTVGSLPHVAGLNLEFMGMAAREQPGVLEYQRKQAAIATLGDYFNAMRLYRKIQGRVLLNFINEYMSDGRLIRIVGDEQARYVPLMRLPESFEYDVIVDEAPNSPDQKMRTWEALTQVLPVAAKMGIPVPPDVLKYAPFPQVLIQEWMTFIKENSGQPSPEEIQRMQEEMQKLQQENQQLKLKKEESMAKVQMEQEKAQNQMAIEQEKLQMELFVQMQKLQVELQKMQMQMGMEQERMGMEMGMEQQRHEQEMAMSEQQQQHDMTMSEREFEHSSEMADRKGEHDMKMAEKNAAAKAKQEKAKRKPND